MLCSVYSRSFCSFPWLGSEIKEEKKTEPRRTHLTQPFLAAYCNVDLKRTSDLCCCLINLEARGGMFACVCASHFGLISFVFRPSAPSCHYSMFIDRRVIVCKNLSGRLDSR